MVIEATFLERDADTAAKSAELARPRA